MIGSMEKGIEAAKVASPPKGTFEGVDLRKLPKYIAYEAALLKSKSNYEYLLLLLCVIGVVYFGISRIEVSKLNELLRSKDYILVDGLKTYSAVSPNNVSTKYVKQASLDLLLNLGNTNSINIVDQYQNLADSMAPKLKIRFLMEAEDWIRKVKKEDLAEILTVLRKEIISDNEGHFKVTALARREIHSNGELIDQFDETIEMVLKLVPPDINKRWYLEITDLKRSKIESFKTKPFLNNDQRKESDD